MVPGIFLAAGEGKRFGAEKLLFPLDGEPLFIRSLRASCESSLEEIVVVLGHDAEKIEQAIREYILDLRKIKIVINPRYKEGMISSFNSGLSVLNGDEKGALMILADMPFVRSATIDKLIRSWNGRDFLIPEINGEKRHPRIIPRILFKEFLEMGSLHSGMAVLEKNRDLIKTLSFVNDKEFRDIDQLSDIPEHGSLNYL